jgi:hypothetical protein
MTAWQKALLVLALAWILTLALIKIFISSIYDVIPPKPPTAAEMKVIESRFFEMRPQLESVVDLVQSTGWDSLLRTRANAARMHEDARAARAQEDLEVIDARADKLLASMRSRLVQDNDGHGFVEVRSESLIYVRALIRRGRGASAGWCYAGYIYSSEWPEHATRQLTDHWYLYSYETGPG